jgi:hypothetical protein
MNIVNTTVYAVVAAVAFIAKFAWHSDVIAGFAVGLGVSYAFSNTFGRLVIVKTQPSKALVPIMIASGCVMVVSLHSYTQPWGADDFWKSTISSAFFAISTYLLYWSIKWYRQVREREQFDQQK